MWRHFCHDVLRWVPMDVREQLLLWWGRRHIGETIRRRALRRALRVCVGISLQSRAGCVLDAGCGRGDNALWVARCWPKLEVHAVDNDLSLVALVARRAKAGRLRNISAAVGDIVVWSGHGDAQARSADACVSYGYGIIYSVDVFEHLGDPAAALQHLASLLSPGGTMMLHVPQLRQRRFFRRFEQYEQHDHARGGFAPADLVQLAGSAGLHVVSFRHTFGIPGAFAWELFHLAQRVGRWCVLLTYPVPWFLAQCDGLVRWQKGNGVLVVMRAA